MNLTDFEKLLEEDLAWRKLEIATLNMLSKTTSESILLKSMILLLYAHWEGFIKRSSKQYLKYVSEKKVSTKHLCHNFLAVLLKTHITRCIETKDSLTLSSEIAFINKLAKVQDIQFKSKNSIEEHDNDIIDTEANLKPKVFKNILHILGLDYKNSIETREHYINSHLLGNRNMIGHGSLYKPIDPDFDLNQKDIDRLKDVVLAIIDNFKEELIEYAKQEYFLLSNENNRIAYTVSQNSTFEKQLKNIEDSYKI